MPSHSADAFWLQNGSPDQPSDPSPTPGNTPDAAGSADVPEDWDEDALDELEAEESDDLEAEVDADAGAQAGERHRRVFEVKRVLDDVRVDVYLQQHLKGISRARVQKLIELGGITINSQAVKPSTRLRRGDLIEVLLPSPAVRTIEPEDIPLEIVFEDRYFIVINKQAGLIVHPARSHRSGTLVNALAGHFKKKIEAEGGSFTPWTTRGFRKPSSRPAFSQQASKEQGEDEQTTQPISGIGARELRPGIIHRLDKYTTGLIVVAKHEDAHWQLAAQFERRQTDKAYLALVHGAPDPALGPVGEIREPIGKHPTIREAFAVRHDANARDSLTIFKVRERYQGYTLLELELRTGRTHQIRVHLQYVGMPIAGDIVYGGEVITPQTLANPPLAAGSRRYVTFARTREQGLALEAQAAADPSTLLAHPALHAGFLRFTHPITQQKLTFTAPLHQPMRSLIEELRKRPAPGPVARDAWIHPIA